MLLPFVKQLVRFSEFVIKDKKDEEKELTLRYVDDRLLAMPAVALMQVKKEIDYMLDLAEDNIRLSFSAMETSSVENGEKIEETEHVIDFTNSALTKFLINLSPEVEQSDEKLIGSYFHVLNDVERIGDHAENLFEIAEEMHDKKITFSNEAQEKLRLMFATITDMFKVSKVAFENLDKDLLPELSELEDKADTLKKELTSSHFTRLAEGACSIDCSPYYSSIISGLERVADHLVNVGYSITNPTGSQTENE